MKIIKIISVMFIAVFVLSGNVMAYSTDSYSIELPSTYTDKNTDTSANPALFIKDATTGLPNFNVYRMDNNDNVNAKNSSSSDIEEIANSLCNQIYSSYKIKVDVIKKEKVTLNGYNAIFISTKWNSKDTAGYEMYQNQYIMTSKKYIYTLTFTTNNEEEFESTEMVNIKNSFIIKDELQKNSVFDIGTVFKIVIMCVSFGLVLPIIRKKLNRD